MAEEEWRKLPPEHNSEAETVQFPPTLARAMRVAAGLAEWSAAEQAWLEAHPQWREHEERLREAIERIEKDRGFTQRLEEKRRDGEAGPERE